MRLTFDGITIGRVKNYGIKEIQGLSADLKNINIEVPGTDFTRNITDRLATKIRTFSGIIVGDNAGDFRSRKRELANKIRNTYTFTLEDIYQSGTTNVTFETYEFTGKIITVDPNRNFGNRYANYVLQIQCADPLIYKASATSGEAAIPGAAGIHIPAYIPAQFGESAVDIEITNSGETAGYVDVTLTGPGSVFTISNTDTGLVYTLNTTLVSGETVDINPRPSQEVNTTDSSGTSLENLVSGSYEAFKISAGDTNTLHVSVNFGEGAATAISYSFQDPFIAI